MSEDGGGGGGVKWAGGPKLSLLACCCLLLAACYIPYPLARRRYLLAWFACLLGRERYRNTEKRLGRCIEAERQAHTSLVQSGSSTSSGKWPSATTYAVGTQLPSSLTYTTPTHLHLPTATVRVSTYLGRRTVCTVLCVRA